MPIYEYVCSTCDHTFDTLQKMSDTPLSVCPACEQPALKKKISAPSFRLSGSGWYETDFKSDKQKNLAKADTGDKDAGKADKAADAKSDKTTKADKTADKGAAA